MEQEQEKTLQLLNIELQRWGQISEAVDPQSITDLLDRLILLIQERQRFFFQAPIEIDLVLGRLREIQNEDLGFIRYTYNSKKEIDKERFKTRVAIVVDYVQRVVRPLIGQ